MTSVFRSRSRSFRASSHHADVLVQVFDRGVIGSGDASLFLLVQVAEDFRDPSLILGTRFGYGYFSRIVPPGKLNREVERGVGLVEAKPQTEPFIPVAGHEVDGQACKESPQKIVVVKAAVLEIRRCRIPGAGQAFRIQPGGG